MTADEELEVDEESLTSIIKTLAIEVPRLRLAVEKTNRRYRSVRAVALIAVGGVVLAGWSTFDNRQAAHMACVRDNTMRQANLNLWRPLIAQYPAPPPLKSDATAEERTAYEQAATIRAAFIKTLEGGFALHDC